MFFNSEKIKTAKTICHRRIGNVSDDPAAADYFLFNYQVCKELLKKNVRQICRRENFKNDQFNVLTPEKSPPLNSTNKEKR